MASQQGQKQAQSEEPKVQKLAQRFEDLGKDEGTGVEKHLSGSGAEKKDIIPKEGSQVQGVPQKAEYSYTLEDIAKYRAQAQQNSMEAIRGAEERYANAKEATLSASQKDQPQGGTGGKDTENRGEHTKTGKGETLSRDQTEGGHGGGKETGETAQEEGKKSSDYATAAKETIVSVGKTVIDYTKHAAEQAKEVAMEKGAPAVHYIADTTKSVAGYAGEKAVAAKDTTLDVGKKAAGYTGEKAVQANDTTLGAGKTAAGTTAEVGKNAAGYVGTKAGQAKDVVLETGLKAAHYTFQKAAEATEATAGMGRKAEEVTREKADTIREEALRKEQEANQKAEEMKRSAEGQKGGPKFDEYKEERTEMKPEGQHGCESLIGAVGETVAEIIGSTKEMVIGKEPDQKS